MVKSLTFIKSKYFTKRELLLAITMVVVVFSFIANFAFAAETKISSQEVERIKTALDIVNTASNIGNVLVDGGGLMKALNTVIKGGQTATDVTYGLLVLSAINEMEFIDLVLSQDYKGKAREYFTNVLDERTKLTSYWKGVGYDIPRVLSGRIVSPAGALTLNTFEMTDKVILILSAFKNLQTELRYDGLWRYFDERMHGESHQGAWELAEPQMGFAAKSTFLWGTPRIKENNQSQLEDKFSALWEKWGPYVVPGGISKQYKEQVKSDLRDTVDMAVEEIENALAEEKPSPSLFDKVLAQLENVKNAVANLASQANPFKAGPVAELPVEPPVDNLESVKPGLTDEEKAADVGFPPVELTPELAPEPELEVEVAEEPVVEAAQPVEEQLQVEPEPLPEPVVEPQPALEPIEEDIAPEGPKLCQKGDGGTARQYRVLINEVAWMGNQDSPNNEWIELKNIWGIPVNLAGWQLQDKDRQIKVIFEENDIIPAGGYYLLERTDDDSLPNVTADKIYTGALANSDEALYLFDNNCQLEDEIMANPNWPGGDNFDKKTMQRFEVLSWYTGVVTAGVENSPPPAILEHPSAPAAPAPETTISKPSYPQILITETQISPQAERFVELYNPNETEVNLTDWYIQKKTATGDSFNSFITSTKFEGKIIMPQGYFFIARAAEDADIIFENMALAKNNTLLLKNPDQDIVDEVSTGSPSTNESFGRKWRDINQSYIDTDSIDDFEIQIPTPGAQNQSSDSEDEIPVVVQDDFNNYANGSIIGQGGWESYINGENFIVQEDTVFEGVKALYNGSPVDNVITKAGVQVPDGGQVFYIKTEDRDNWGENAEVQVRVTRGPWASGDSTWSFIAVTFEKDGDVGYSVEGTERNYFATYNDNEWIKLETEWRSNDRKARYRLNDGIWTEWDIFWNSDYFAYFDYVGLDFDLRSGGSGGVYFDALGEILSTQEDEDDEDGDEGDGGEETGAEPLAVVFNEIAWMGTRANSDDEWLELYNNTENDIDLTGWKIKKDYDDWIEFSASAIPAQGYFLLERTADDAISDISADQIYTGALSNTGKTLELYDALGNLIDYIYADSGWPAGESSTRQTMERINSSAESDSDNWGTNNGITRNGLDADSKSINGTPKSENSSSKEFTEVIGDRIFDEDLILTIFGSPYIWQGSLIVEEGAELTVEPGVEIQFKNDGHSQLKVMGKLEASDVVFTSYSEDQPWDGIYFENSISTLDNVTVRYGGLLHEPSSYEYAPYTYGAIHIDGGKVVITNSLVEKSDTFGLWLENSTTSQVVSTEFRENQGAGYNGKAAAALIESSDPTIKDSIFRNNTVGILVENQSAPTIKNNQFIENTTPIQISSLLTEIIDNTFQDNGDNGVLVSDFGFSSQYDIINWKKINAPYFVENTFTIPFGYKLVIKPGVEIRLRGLGQINIDGTLEADGTAQNKIIFTGASEVPGAWRYIKFSASSTDSILDHVIVRYGGVASSFGSGAPDRGAITIENTSVKITHSLIENNYFAGVYLINSDSVIKNTAFSDNNVQYSWWGSGSYSQGLYIYNSSPDLTNSSFKRNYYGIYVEGDCPDLSDVIFGSGDDANTYDIFPDSCVPQL